jgi:N6-adenosine-specific RNA methylase IME4
MTRQIQRAGRATPDATGPRQSNSWGVAGCSNPNPAPTQDLAHFDQLEHAGSYGALLVDPPWHWRARSAKGDGRAPPYARMGVDEIKALPIDKLAAPDAALFLWILDSLLPEALSVIEAWQFRFINVAFVWAKTNRTKPGFAFSTGYWSRKQTELCLLATCGRPKRLARDVPQLIVAPRREHSRKPDGVRQRIERLVAGPFLELFARERARGWDTWGLELDRFPVSDDVVKTALPAQAASLRVDL